MSASYIETIYRDGIKELFRLEQNFIPLWSEGKERTQVWSSELHFLVDV